MFGRRSTPTTRSSRACSICTSMPVTSRRSKAQDHMQDVVLRNEFGGMSEALYNLAAATNDARWAKVGDRFQKTAFITPLAQHRDELRGLHINTQVPQVSGAARRYELTGDARFH